MAQSATSSHTGPAASQEPEPEGTTAFPELVSIVVPTHRRPDALRATLTALTELHYPSDGFEVIVVDDASEAATYEVVRALEGGPLRITYLPQSHAGVARARNNGAEHARGEVLIFLDDDMIVEPDHISQHLTTRARFGDCLVNGHWDFAPEVKSALEATPFGRFRLVTEDWVKTGITKERLEDGIDVPSGVTAANLSIARELFFSLGGFDESFPMAGCEDQDFSQRAAEAGCRFIYNHRIRLWHNDHRLTLRQFCVRQEQGAITAVYLASKHGGDVARRNLITENTPISSSDSPRIVLKKALKKLLSARPLLAAEHRAIWLLERMRPRSRLLRRAYWGMFGLYIFRGIRKGLEAIGADARRLASSR